MRYDIVEGIYLNGLQMFQPTYTSISVESSLAAFHFD